MFVETRQPGFSMPDFNKRKTERGRAAYRKRKNPDCTANGFPSPCLRAADIVVGGGLEPDDNGEGGPARPAVYGGIDLPAFRRNGASGFPGPA